MPLSLQNKFRTKILEKRPARSLYAARIIEAVIITAYQRGARDIYVGTCVLKKTYRDAFYVEDRQTSFFRSQKWGSAGVFELSVAERWLCWL